MRALESRHVPLRQRVSAGIAAMVLASLVLMPGPAWAFTSSPTAPVIVRDQPALVSVVATGLRNPRGLAVGPDGTLYVAEAGQGGDRAIKAGFYQIPFKIGRTARVTQVTPAGEQQILLDSLPSVHTPDDVFGPTGVAYMGDSLYVLTSAGGRDVGDPTYDNQILRVGLNGEVTSVANLTQLNYQNPPLARLRDLRADVEGGVPYGLTAFDGRLYATDANLETVTEIGLDGSSRRLVELPASNRVLVGLTPAPDGSIWVAEYGPIPHQTGNSKISRLTLDGEYTPAWTGLTETIGVAFGPDSSAYALQFSNRNRDPRGGSLIRRWPDNREETIITGLDRPTGIATGPDGSLYISERGHQSDDGSGRVIKVQIPSGG